MPGAFRDAMEGFELCLAHGVNSTESVPGVSCYSGWPEKNGGSRSNVSFKAVFAAVLCGGVVLGIISG